jgi:hypothetical protein
MTWTGIARRWGAWGLALAAFALVLLVNGALPGVAMPTLGQGVWTASFGQSIANQHGLALYARDFGLPVPAPIPFGLAGALPCGWLILAGLHPADAYAAMVAFWLAMAFLGAYSLARGTDSSHCTAILLAMLWLTLPIVWEHADYSMLSLGIALLPAYVQCSMLALRKGGASLGLLFAASIIAVFMDGYTFIMYAGMTLALVMADAWSMPGMRMGRLVRGWGWHVAALTAAYTLYRQYAHPGQYETASMDFFRAWGLDLSYLAVPTRGEYWLWDLLGVGVTRSASSFFGDASTWTTTFGLPFLLLVMVAIFRRGDARWKWMLILVMLGGFYLALGPSLKIDARRSAPPTSAADLTMPDGASLLPTGAAMLYRHVPGVSFMRASYRWIALGLLAGWLLLAWMPDRRATWLWPLLALVVICDLPHPLDRFREGVQYRRMLQAIDEDFVTPLPNVGGQPVAFVPYGNDFLAAYAAARKRMPTFNVGGDKGLAMAVSAWPESMRALSTPPAPEAGDPIVAFLAKGIGAGVVIPYVDLLEAAHFWPCPAGPALGASTTHRHGSPSYDCLRAAREAVTPRLRALARSPFLDVRDYTYFAFVSLRPSDTPANAGRHDPAEYPILPMSGFQRLVLREGWYEPESSLVWSREAAQIVLPVPTDCEPEACTAVVRFMAFGASTTRPVKVKWSSFERASAWHEEITVTSSEPVAVALPLESGAVLRRFSVSVPGATSPAQLTGSADQRVLGIAILEIQCTRASGDAAGRGRGVSGHCA